jgi:uncharacterized membrane protein (UPF0127 family)
MNRLRLALTAILILPIVVIAAYVFVFQSTPSGSVSPPQYTRFEINGKTYSLTFIATNETERAKGLMDTRVTDTTTELFIFPSFDYYPFWMYHVNSSLDIMWLNVTGSVGRVVYMVQSVPGCSVELLCVNYQPTAKANMVLEAKGGFARLNSIVVGSEITFE